MLITKTNPAGVDVPIQKVQEFLHTRLKTLWEIDETGGTMYKAYGRCYRNKSTDYGYIAENYEGGNEYKEVYWDDSLTAISFFGTGNTIKHDKVKEAVDVHLVFFVNLQKVKPTITHRADEEIHRDVLTLIGESMHGMDYTGLDTWIETVLREYPGSRRDNRLAHVDMHPIHCFRLNFSLKYDINIC